jgi:4-alpha-glucanotransferase
MCFSAFAGNPLLISPDGLVEDGWLDPADLEGAPEFPAETVDYAQVIPFKHQLLKQAWVHFQNRARSTDWQHFQHFCQKQATWLEDYALFMAIKSEQQQTAWWTWPASLALPEPATRSQLLTQYATTIELQKFQQFIFDHQWQRLRTYAHQQGIRIIGDLPIYVARDSSDVWGNRSLFQLDPDGQPTFVAGVPPDYFSATGQLWGNPLYNWEAMAETGYEWYLNRLQHELQRVDVVRIDHFRGFAGYYAIPGDAHTAVDGRWIPGPGEDLFNQATQLIPNLAEAVIAEDLGLITPDVFQLRDRYHFKGMKVLQFAFDTAAIRSSNPDIPDISIQSLDNAFLPCNYEPNCVVYTGTHDNDTVVGWFSSDQVPIEDKEALMRYMDRSLAEYEQGRAIHWDLIRLALASVAEWAIIPWQDVLGTGSGTRMNRPSTSEGNWSWRCLPDELNADLADKLARITTTYIRCP